MSAFDALLARQEEQMAELHKLRVENAQLKQWQRDMVKKAADKSLDGYRELGARCADFERERDALAVEFRKVEVLWKEAAIDASRKHDTISGLENACRISLSRIDALQAENKLLRECARTPDLERIDAAIDAAKEKP